MQSSWYISLLGIYKIVVLWFPIDLLKSIYSPLSRWVSQVALTTLTFIVPRIDVDCGLVLV